MNNINMNKLLALFTVLATFLGTSYGKTIYVNANFQTAGNGTSWSSPYTNLQDAVTASVAGDLVLVTNGVYSPIATGNKTITIQSVNGYADTIIDGGGVSRCATLGTGVVLRGFLLKNGYVSGNGGGVYYGSVYDSMISNNLATGNGGGAAYSALVSNCVVVGNSAPYGGGIYNGTLRNCVVSNNVATVMDGGGVIHAAVYDSLIVNNSAERNGGGSYSGTLTGCTIYGNTANNRGGGSFLSSLFNTIVSNNIAIVNGGGCYNGTLNSCLVVGNMAPVGSQIRNQDSNFSAYNSTIIGTCSFPNTTRNIFNNIFYGANVTFPVTAQVGFNIFSGTLTGGTIIGPNLTSTDPLFTDPLLNDFSLRPESPCINKGANQYVTTATDLAGRPRIKDWRVDMGAYENQSQRFAVTPNPLYPMGRVQLFGAASSRLPAGYRECNWIESTGTQYINTGIYPTLKNTAVDVLVSSMAYNNRLLGVSQNIGGTIYRYRGYCGSININMYVGTATTTIPAITNSAVRFRITDGVFQIDNNTTVAWTGTNAVLTAPFLLCAEHDGIVRTASVRLFYAKLWDGHSLVRDYIPCLNPENVAGAYDLVGATFYPNAGTGNFLYELK